MPAFLLPDLGEGLAEAEIVAWRVQAGDVVTVDQTVVEVETAKAVVEVPVPFAGRVTALHGQPGDVLAVGAPLLTVAGNSAPPGPASEAGQGGAEGESGQVLIGYGTSAPRRHRQARAGRALIPRAPAEPPASAEPPAPPPARPRAMNARVAV
ncbi:MAG TPA: biotin/lipoyl-containing protein, partial [Streptosporangiaceae bacterium]|nr:biotin/lipoyl-containing protein [Streptosporangiaceae bacterium]